LASPESDLFPVLETLALIDGIIQNPYFHQQRIAKVQEELYGNHPNLEEIDISRVVEHGFNSWIIHNPPPKSWQGSAHPKVKVRLLYGAHLGPIEFQWYNRPDYANALIISTPRVDYHIKWADRTWFTQVSKSVPKESYPLFCVDGLLTDGLSSNLVIYKDDTYLTPRSPLLKGTMREWLLSSKTLVEADLTPADLYQAKEVILINALNPLGTWTLPVL
jgi:4-amino-4-deoxychorismate lyase